MLLCSVLFGAFWQTGAAHAASTSYYVDCSLSSNGSGTQASPWNSLSAVDSHGAFSAGDTILFKQGTSCSGILNPQGSGTSSSPITINSYAIAGTGYIDPVNNTIRDNVCARNDTGVTSGVKDSGDIFLSTFGTSSPGIVGNQFDGIAIYNNTIYGDQNSARLPSLSLQTTGNVSMFTGSNPDFFKNNIIYAMNPFMVGCKF